MKLKNYILLLIISTLFVFGINKHEYYVSVTNIEYSKEQKSLQIISQIFIDDFEKLLRQRYDDSIVLDSQKESEKANDYMNDYLQNKFKIKVNDKPVTFNFIGKEYKDDITYCYLEVEKIKRIKTIEVSNTILFDVFSEQQNIVRLKMLGKNKSFLLLPDNDKCVLNFD